MRDNRAAHARRAAIRASMDTRHEQRQVWAPILEAHGRDRGLEFGRRPSTAAIAEYPLRQWPLAAVPTCRPSPGADNAVPPPARRPAQTVATHAAPEGDPNPDSEDL